MPDKFFAASKSRKRKRPTADGQKSGAKSPAGKLSADPRRPTTKAKAKAVKGKRPAGADEELNSDHTNEDDIDDLDLRPPSDEQSSGDEFENETPAEKRLRLAKLYLESVREELADGEFDAAEIDKELISARLKQDVLEHSGKVHLYIAESFDFTAAPPTLRTKRHRLSVTCAVASESGSYLYTAGKEGSIIKWDLSTGVKLHTFYKQRPGKEKAKGKDQGMVNGHTDQVLALAISGDGKYLTSSGNDRRIGVWDVEKNEWIRAFVGHKGIISALSFRKGTNQLYTASHDRTVKLFDLSESVMGYVETLFGHQDVVVGLDALRAETAISVGGRDKTVRFWKIVEETQLVFRGGGRSRIREVLEGGLGALEAADHEPEPPNTTEKNYIEGSIECVAMIDESTFVSGGDSGSISLWTLQKKKPIFTQPLAHGLACIVSSTEGPIETPRWVTSLASLRYSDLFASGSWDHSVRLWKLSSSLKDFSPVGTIPAFGVINSLQFIMPTRTYAWASSLAPPKASMHAKTTLLIAGVGQEHRLGRWIKVKGEGAEPRTNCALVFALRRRRT